MRHHSEKEKMYKYIGLYNSFVMGVHQYYAIATEVNKDFHKISFRVNRTLKRKLGDKLKRPNISNLKCRAIVDKYGKSMELRCVYNLPIIPIAYVQHRNPMWKRAVVNKYTEEGRAEIHKSLKGIDMNILLYLMRNPIPNRSIEYNDNRISLYSGQMGKCAVTGKRLCIDDIHCHHKIPRMLGGDDSYGNLKIVHADIHRLIHAVKTETIKQLLEKLKLTEYQLGRVNALRKLCNLEKIEMQSL